MLQLTDLEQHQVKTEFLKKWAISIATEQPPLADEDQGMWIKVQDKKASK